MRLGFLSAQQCLSSAPQANVRSRSGEQSETSAGSPRDPPQGPRGPGQGRSAGSCVRQHVNPTRGMHRVHFATDRE